MSLSFYVAELKMELTFSRTDNYDFFLHENFDMIGDLYLYGERFFVFDTTSDPQSEPELTSSRTL